MFIKPYGRFTTIYFLSHILFIAILAYTSYRTVFIYLPNNLSTVSSLSFYQLEHYFYMFNVAFHELGHWVFLPFGEIMNVLGGTIAEFIFPALFIMSFKRSDNTLGILFCIWWISHNFITSGIYMKDAFIRVLPLLVEGGTHDWWYIFNRFGILNRAAIIGKITIGIGIAVMVFSLFYYVYYLLSLFVNRSKTRRDFL